MQSRWVNKNMDLASLSTQIIFFFEERRFRVERKKLKKGYQIECRPEVVDDLIKGVTVKILGEPNDFAIEYQDMEQTHTVTMLGRIMSLFGGGILVLKGLKSQEAQKKFENKFWSFIDKTIATMVDSYSETKSD